jgi:hypothetical protein
MNLTNNDKSEQKKIPINILLSEELSKYILELKNYHHINNNNDMIRNIISDQYKAMLKEKKELGLLMGDFIQD